MQTHTKVIVGTLGVIVLLLVAVWAARPSESSRPAEALNDSPLTAEIQKYEFGQISMANGLVRYQFKVRNSGIENVKVTKMYTSCMCTKALLITSEKTWGPYGMPAHGFPIPAINQDIAPGAEIIVEAVFDPNAHGPAGVGRIERTVFLENDKGRPYKLDFSANVIP